MTNESVPRIVTVRRPSEYEEVLAAHGTRGQAEFFLKTRGQSMDVVWSRHELMSNTLQAVLGAIPSEWRRASVLRDDLDRFSFTDDDIVVVVGQDGLVANVAKYLSSQPVIGVNPDPSFYEGVLVRHEVSSVADLMTRTAVHDVDVEARTMAHVALDDGRTLNALNEIFIGHRSHQSARYHLCFGDREEDQSSSGVIVSTGTGSTGWARSIWTQRHTELALPRPAEHRLVFFTREAWPSRSTQTNVTEGNIGDGETLSLTSRLGTGGVIFGDGIEADALEFDWGRIATVGIASTALHMVMA